MNWVQTHICKASKPEILAASLYSPLIIYLVIYTMRLLAMKSY